MDVEVHKSENNEILVSIIIPAFNVQKWIDQCVRSALNQSYGNIEVIVIDDGSSDETPSIVNKITKTDSRLRLVQQENQGPSTARNRGIRLSEGTLLIFLDADDWIHRDTVADAVKLFNEVDPDIVMIECAKYYSQTKDWSSATDEFYWRLSTSNLAKTMRVFDKPEILAFYPLAQLKIVSKNLLVENNVSFPENVRGYEDNAFHISQLSLNPRCALLSKKYYAWRQERPGQFTGTARTVDCLIAFEDMLESAKKLNERAFPFLIVSLTRLVSGVAKCISSTSERQQFIDTAVQTLRESIEPHRLQSARDWIPKSTNIHPGDKILVTGLLENQHLLAAALGSGINRYPATIQLLVLTSRVKGIVASLLILSKLLFSARLLINYSRGVGESRIDGLG